MAKRIVTKIGDIFCVEINGNRKSYFQYIANDMSMLNSSVIRVFKTNYSIDTNPKIEQIVNDGIAFYAHTVLKAGIQHNAWYKIGTSKETDEETAANVIFAFASISDIYSPNFEAPKDPLSNWYIWKINTDLISVGKLPKEFWNIAEPGGVYSYIEIVSRIKSGYYGYTRIEYDVLKRKPLPDVDSYIKVVGENETSYYQFKGQYAVKELIVSASDSTKLTTDRPEANGYELRKAEFGETNWHYNNFISQEEFEDAWRSY
ncbi:MAG: immunity 26/phosphotriesterase HocA family protein [Muribaculaceae bacterium]|nr:immunity 26/phosphotriesterase HocA family protein [Muribaculaceae bacterium]